MCFNINQKNVYCTVCTSDIYYYICRTATFLYWQEYNYVRISID